MMFPAGQHYAADKTIQFREDSIARGRFLREAREADMARRPFFMRLVPTRLSTKRSAAGIEPARTRTIASRISSSSNR